MITQRLVGIGAGPANLSLAALLDTSEDALDDVFLETKETFRWHAGMMLPDAEMQVHFLKDLVTPVDPTNPHSILAYMVSRGELYRMLNTRRQRLSRRGYEAYCSWVAARLPAVRFGTEVLDVRWDAGFRVTTSRGTFRSRHLSVGTGVVPRLPDCATQTAGWPQVTHSAHFLDHPVPRAARRVVVVGGGQSGAEVVAHLQERLEPGSRIEWVTRRGNFLPLDESPFVEDLFTPEASEEFFHRPPEIRSLLLSEQRLASDGVSDSLLERIYQRMFDIRNGYREGPHLATRVSTELTGLERTGTGAVRLGVVNRLSGEGVETQADHVVLATGYSQELPPAVAPLVPLLATEEGHPQLRPDFSVRWDGPDSHRIYLQNGARHARGVADPNLSLLAWRSAAIAVSVAPDLGKRLLEPHLPLDVGPRAPSGGSGPHPWADRTGRNSL
ncbi:SidA/IucD/PvdA family monooxygenase [Streptomyces sp. NPDC091267]|uniref:lysine N(6)-hydroxylase/L-ornithine N(5)-oxygenase family protein n=1 Tax=unclassified Streptomyces TaxID=2593676 RepID=UPI00343C3298